MSYLPVPECQHPLREIFQAFLRLGLTSFGGPVAHLGYFREEFVVRRSWMTEAAYADLIALCQFLPGPASSQVVIGIGLSRGGVVGAFFALLAFSMPSALILILFACGVSWFEVSADSGWLLGFKVAAVAVVAQAVVGMSQRLCPDHPRRWLAVMAVALTLCFSGIQGQLMALVLTAFIGQRFAPYTPISDSHGLKIDVSRRLALCFLLTFFILLLLLPFVSRLFDSHLLILFDSFYRSGALVFGGGHVVLPLLQAEVVGSGWLDMDLFIAGYGAAQAIPGPLFTFSAYLGAAMGSGAGRLLLGLLCLIAIFLPGFLLVIGILPYWDRLQHNRKVRRLLYGINAGVVGLLGAAFIHPVFTSGVQGPLSLLLAIGAYWLLVYRKLAPWLVVVTCGLVGVVVL